jgi:hypothetical protein
MGRENKICTAIIKLETRINFNNSRLLKNNAPRQLIPRQREKYCE